VWQGQSDSPLTDRGTWQLKRLSQRISGRHYDLVIASDLERTVISAEALSLPFETDSEWREIDIGAWEGFTRAEVAAMFGESKSALAVDRTTAMGGAESFLDLGERVDVAVSRLLDRLGEGDRALVMTHGGVIHAVVGGLLGFRERAWPSPIGRLINSSMTTLRLGDDGLLRLVAFNDGTHVDDIPVDGDRVVVVRHGRTAANVEGRWHGITDSPLDDTGRDQARLLAKWRSDFAAIYASPLQRAQDTADVIATSHGIPLHTSDALMEFDYGDWEDRTSEEIESTENWVSFAAGEDVARGNTGETNAQVEARMAGAIAGARQPGAIVGAVSHGGAIRSYVAGVVGAGSLERRLLVVPDNTATSTVAFREHGPVLVDYNLSPHLEGVSG
jgi:probable phosphoglycerate mutase